MNATHAYHCVYEAGPWPNGPELSYSDELEGWVCVYYDWDGYYTWKGRNSSTIVGQSTGNHSNSYLISTMIQAKDRCTGLPWIFRFSDYNSRSNTFYSGDAERNGYYADCSGGHDYYFTNVWTRKKWTVNSNLEVVQYTGPAAEY